MVGVATAIVAARTLPESRLGKAVPPIVSRSGATTISSVLALRGIGGVIAGTIGYPAATPPFRLLNLVAYSPLCLALATAVRRIDGPHFSSHRDDTSLVPTP